ncbi:MAG TPA: aspartate-semialdehyde dehydrogenase [Nitrospiria bacterium]|jgi:aspartate-semialdehyde dehydrogenase
MKKKDKYVVGILGATGAVGNEMVEILEERSFPVEQLLVFASERSEGNSLIFQNKKATVQTVSSDSFNGIDIALFSAGAKLSQQYAPVAVKAGAVVIDNSSAFRMDPNVPLVVPEVNPDALKGHQGIIANPNCSTIQMVMALKPIHDAARIKRIVVTTFQSVSGTGKEAMDELLNQTRALLGFSEMTSTVYPYQIAFNCLPHIDEFIEGGYTKEELKMVNETHKILSDSSIGISATTVRVPVFRGHSESINLELDHPLSANEVRALLSSFPGIIVWDDIKKNVYPFPVQASGKDEVFVGRVREDPSVPNGINLWVVSDNLRKGAALNAIQIAEHLIHPPSPC